MLFGMIIQALLLNMALGMSFGGLMVAMFVIFLYIKNCFFYFNRKREMKEPPKINQLMYGAGLFVFWSCIYLAVTTFRA